MPTVNAFPPADRDERSSVRTRDSRHMALRPTGRAGRAVILAASTAIGGGAAAALVFIGLGGNAIGWIIAAAPLLSVYTWAWARWPWVGVYVGDNEVIARSWWRTRRLNRADMSRWNADSYTGWLYVAGWPVAGGALEPGNLRLSTVAGRSIALAGTVTWRATAREQASTLNDWLGLDRPRREGIERAAPTATPDAR